MKSSGGAEGGQAQGGWSEGFAQTFLLLLLFRVGHNLAIEQRQQFFFFFCPHHKALGILVLPPGIEPAPPCSGRMES